MFHAFWREQMVYENGRVKRFETEGEAWEYLARCDLAGKSYIKPLIGAAVLLLQSVDGGIIAIWATVAIHRQKLICSRRSSRQTLHRPRQASQNRHCVPTNLQRYRRHLMRYRQTYRAHSGTSTMISLTDCLQR